LTEVGTTVPAWKHRRFLELCRVVEKYIADAGIILIKHWMEVGKKEQQRRCILHSVYDIRETMMVPQVVSRMCPNATV
jgi:polyphosphate kinase